MIPRATAISRERLVEIPAGRRRVRGFLSLPREPRAVIAFAHGSGSGRFSPRNQFVAGVLQDAGMATLLIDLLEEDEVQDRQNVFDIELLADRLRAAGSWLGRDSEVRGLPLGYFGASTGAAAALVAAAGEPKAVGAIVSRGGRPDLAWNTLPAVAAPTLLIVGGRDQEVLALNRRALALLSCAKELVVVPGATHLFEESGALEEVARLATRWFLRHLGSSSPAAGDESETASADAEGELGARFPRFDMDTEC
jgi:putative phosphoribosyl transferase